MPQSATAPWPVTFRERTVRPVLPRSSPTVDDAIVLLLRAVDEGTVRDAHGRRLSADAARELRWVLRGHVSEALGDAELTRVRARHVQALLGDLRAAGLPARRVRAVAGGVRMLYDHAVERGLARYNPAERLALAPAAPAPAPRSDVLVGRALEIATAGFALVAVVILL